MNYATSVPLIRLARDENKQMTYGISTDGRNKLQQLEPFFRKLRLKCQSLPLDLPHAVCAVPIDKNNLL